MKKIILCLVLTALIFNFSLEAYGANNSLLGKVTTDKNEYALNEAVRFLFTITNSTNTPITLTFNTSQIYDFEIVKDGKVVFKWGIGRMFAQVITKVTVPANGTKAFSVIWGMVDNKGNKVDVGTYSVRFYLVNNNGAEATTTFVIGTPTFTPVFPDVTDYYTSKYLKELVGKGIVKGYPDGTFGGTRNLTRAEATVLIMRALGIEPKAYSASSFADVEAKHWAHNYIEEGVKRGIIQGVTSTQFAPQRTITRGEFVTILMRALNLTNDTAVSPFVDVAYSYFGYREIATAFNLNIVQGSVDNNELKFYPNDPITRNSAILILARAMEVKE